MTTMSWPMVTGVVAALCTTLAFLPQLFKMKKQGATGLSTAMLTVYLAGLGLWLVYGLMVGAVPGIAANVASMIIVSAGPFPNVPAGPARGPRPPPPPL